MPVSALASWGGCTTAGAIIGGVETPDDHDRACAVDDLAGAIAVGDAGTFRVRAIYAEADGHIWVGLVYLLPTSP